MRKKILPSFLAISFWLSPHLYADTSKIEALEQENSGYHKTIKENAKSVSSYKSKTERATEVLLQAKRSLVKAEEALALTQEKYNKNSSPENLRLLEMSSDRRALAMKKVAAKEKRLEGIKVEVNQLATSDSSLNALIKRNVLEIRNLKNELRKSKLQAAAEAKREAQSKVSVAELPVATVVPAQTLEPVPAQPAAQVKLSGSEVKPVGKVKSVVTEVSADKVSKMVESKGVDYSSATNPMISAVAEIKEYLSGGVSRSAKTLRSIATTHRGKKIDFSHLGGEIYSGEAKLVRGQHTVTFDNSRFKIKVAADDHRKAHVLYFDNRSEKRHLIVIEKSMEAGL